MTSPKIDMVKRVNAALESLQKVVNESKIDLGELNAQVTLSADRSLSARKHWPEVYQEAIERALALTLTGLDDDGEVPFIAFDSEIVGEGVLHNRPGEPGYYEGFVADIHARAGRMKGTEYAPVLDKLLAMGQRKRLLGRTDERDAPPFLHLFFTDGAPSDKGPTKRRLISARERPHFVQFIVIGGDERAKEYMNTLDNELKGPGLDNVGVTIYEGMPADDDTAFFNDVIGEFFHQWLPAARAAGYTRF